MSSAHELPRVIEQVIRNNIARTLSANQDLDAHLNWGLDEYFEMWGDGAFPWVEGGKFILHPNSAVSAAERAALIPLVDELNAARNACDGMQVETFLASPWPAKIVKLSADAYAIMRARGCFSEATEEQEPSATF